MALLTRARLRELYFGESGYALRFQAMWIIFDLTVIAFFIAAPFAPHNAAFYSIDYLIAASAARRHGSARLDLWRHQALDEAPALLGRPCGDAVAGPALLWHQFGLPAGAARLFHNPRGRLLARDRGRALSRHAVADTAKAAVNLLVFVFVMAGLVHSIFAARVASIGSYIDSLYFTVTTLNTTGFGDIVPPGVAGRLISILIMIGGVSLFFRLIHERRYRMIPAVSINMRSNTLGR